MGGNKIRKLEFLVADALAQGADTLITCGAIQSNHCRLTLAAAGARRAELPLLVLKENVPGSYDPQAGGNILLFRLLAAEKIRVIPAGDPADPVQEMQLLAQQLAAEGRKAYIIPMGGSTPARGCRLCRLRAGDLSAEPGATDFFYRRSLPQRQRRHSRRFAGRFLGAASGCAGCRDQCDAEKPRAGRSGASFGAGNSRFAGKQRQSAARTGSSAMKIIWDRAIRCLRRKWWRRCGCWPKRKEFCWIRYTPARRWPG